jgi:hypothetical protein
MPTFETKNQQLTKIFQFQKYGILSFYFWPQLREVFC